MKARLPDTPDKIPLADWEGFARRWAGEDTGQFEVVAFSGDESTSVAKGQWPVPDSPLVWLLDESAVTAAAHPRREPLARPEPVFDSASGR